MTSDDNVCKIITKLLLNVVDVSNKGIDNIAVIGGGIIPEEDKKELENKGISGNFGPGTSMETIIDHIKKVVK